MIHPMFAERLAKRIIDTKRKKGKAACVQFCSEYTDNLPEDDKKIILSYITFWKGQSFEV